MRHPRLNDYFSEGEGDGVDVNLASRYMYVPSVGVK